MDEVGSNDVNNVDIEMAVSNINEAGDSNICEIQKKNIEVKYTTEDNKHTLDEPEELFHSLGNETKLIINHSDEEKNNQNIDIQIANKPDNDEFTIDEVSNGKSPIDKISEPELYRETDDNINTDEKDRNNEDTNFDIYKDLEIAVQSEEEHDTLYDDDISDEGSIVNGQPIELGEGKDLSDFNEDRDQYSDREYESYESAHSNRSSVSRQCVDERNNDSYQASDGEISDFTGELDEGSSAYAKINSSEEVGAEVVYKKEISNGKHNTVKSKNTKDVSDDDVRSELGNIDDDITHVSIFIKFIQ